MGSRGRQRRKKGRQPPRSTTLCVEMRSVELVRGHDGLLRGKPEPVLMVAAYARQPNGLQLMGRALRRPEIGSRYPMKIEMPEPVLFRAAIQASCHHIVLLTLALEEDDGEGVKRVYGALAKPTALSVWPADAALPEPLALDELSQSLPNAEAGFAANVIVEQEDLRDLCQSDSMIGAQMMTLPTERNRWTRLLRFRDELGRNDWTAELQITI